MHIFPKFCTRLSIYSGAGFVKAGVKLKHKRNNSA